MQFGRHICQLTEVGCVCLWVGLQSAVCWDRTAGGVPRGH